MTASVVAERRPAAAARVLLRRPAVGRRGQVPAWLVAVVGGVGVGSIVTAGRAGWALVVATAVSMVGLLVAGGAVDEVPAAHPHRRTERLVRIAVGAVAVPAAARGAASVVDDPAHALSVVSGAGLAWVLLAVLAFRSSTVAVVALGRTREASDDVGDALAAAGVPVLHRLTIDDDVATVLRAIGQPTVIIEPSLLGHGLVGLLIRSGGGRLACSVPGEHPARLRLGAVGGLAAIDLDHDPFLPASRAVKRGMDVAVAAVALLLSAPLVAVAAVAIRLDSRGPWLFSQTRVGAGGREFRVYKLRTMRVDNEPARHEEYVAAAIEGTAASIGGLYKLVDDDRRTRVGRILRRLSIDELPQLWNVLRGDMSLVGPRPALPQEVRRYPEPMLDRLAVRPGLTGLWQVSGRSRIGFDRMVELDRRYWQQWSLVLDVRILVRTPLTLIRGETA